MSEITVKKLNAYKNFMFYDRVQGKYVGLRLN